MSFLRRPPLAARTPKQRAGAAAEEENYGDGIAPGRRRGAGGWPACRFDVVTADDQGVTEWIRDAFQAD